MKDMLDILNNKEDLILKEISNLIGNIQEKEKQVDDLKLPVMYDEIHNRYTELSETSVEALKRALFLQWYAVVEPKIYSGIGNLNRQNEEKNISILNNLIASNLIDDELKVMTSYYYSISSWYFKGFESIDNIEKLINTNYKLKDISLMVGRGQMGKYWNSLNK